MRSFCSAKARLIFSTKNFSVFGYKVVKHLNTLLFNLGNIFLLGKYLVLEITTTKSHMKL